MIDITVPKLYSTSELTLAPSKGMPVYYCIQLHSWCLSSISRLH